MGCSGSKGAAPTAAPEGDFKLTVERTDAAQSVGVTIVASSAPVGILVQGLKQEGLVPAYNKQYDNTPEQQVIAGDVIVAVNSVFGNFEQMMKELAQQKVTLTMKRSAASAAEAATKPVAAEAAPEPAAEPVAADEAAAAPVAPPAAAGEGGKEEEARATEAAVAEAGEAAVAASAPTPVNSPVGAEEPATPTATAAFEIAIENVPVNESPEEMVAEEPKKCVCC
eukprot:TRINITY_DN102285_c0_g1_i1.p1 TRINITY_DN102285_c0_g1~~TRINITY_DN102285_c0_g1_i1.p1  ORF type:complete len:225 (+),score=70.13 TRINITY_DN102285_c0_g1_i1:132-806(+)